MTALGSALLRIVPAGLLLGGFGYGLSLLYSGGVPVPVCLGAGLVLAATWVLAQELPAEDIGDLTPAGAVPRQQRLALGDFATWQNRLSTACADQDRFDTRLRPELRRLIAGRLQQRHGLDWLTEPDRARAILGPELWGVLTAPSGTMRATPVAIERWVDGMERM